MNRIIAAAFAACLGATLAACGSSTHTITGPSTNKCAVTATSDKSAFGADGGSGNITVSTNRECQWTAQSSSPWLTLGPTSSGQGDGKVPFTVTANTDPAARRTMVNVNDQQVAISEEAAPCQFTVSPLADTVSPGGERRTIAVGASSPQCAWAATSNVGWMAITSGAPGTGNGTVTYDAQPTSGPTRSGTLTVAGHTVNVTQGTGCAVVISPTGQAVGAAGGSGSISVTTGAGCAWTADTNVPWITLTSGSTGAGPGTVTFTVGAWNGPARTGTIAVSGQVFTITQGEGCSFSLSTSSASVAAGGGSGSVQVITADGCSWRSSSNASWISITSGNSGSGRGTVQFTAAATSGPGRSGTLTVAGQTFTVNQSACSYSAALSGSSSFGASGGSGSIQLSTTGTCAWTATSDQGWVHVSPGSGTGAAAVSFTVDENKTGSSRSATIGVAGQSFTITQAAPCSYSINPPSQNFDSGGGGGTVNVTAGSGCTWTASTPQPWVHITSATSGSGNGSVQFTVDQNTGASARDASISVGGQTFGIHQNAGCSYSLGATGASIPAAGGNGSVSVTAGTNCTWVASAPDGWVQITSGASGTGDGTVVFAVSANSGAARSSTLTIAGIAFTISQEAAPPEPCSYSITPSSADYADSAAHTGSFTLNASRADCAWTASASDTWIQITSAASGSGGATINFSITANDGPARSGTISVAGQTFTITQAAAPCSFTVTLTSGASPPATGGTGSIHVDSATGCAWTASTDSPSWITLSTTNGSAVGDVQFTVAANPGAERTAKITVAGQDFKITQAAAVGALRN